MRYLKRKGRTNSSKDASEPKSMVKLQLVKTATKFFSERGNRRLQRIWLDNHLDDEMIFSVWIGPSEALFRQNVSDYLQAFLLRRSAYVPTRDNTGMLSLLKRFSELTLSADGKRKHGLYNDLIQTTLMKRYAEREKTEKRRIERSIAKNELPVISGFEYISQHPIFRAEQLEKRVKCLSKIPLPYSQEDFEKLILPIMTSLAIEEERKAERGYLNSSNLMHYSSSGTLPKLATDVTEDSGVTSDCSYSSDFDSSINNADYDDDDELVQIFSEMELKSKDVESTLDDTLGDVCEICGGLFNCETNEALVCTCISDPIWNGKLSQTASSMFADASKIIDLHTMKHKSCKEYMKQYYFNNWSK